MAAERRKSRIKVRIFASDLKHAFWLGFFTCFVLMMILFYLGGGFSNG